MWFSKPNVPVFQKLKDGSETKSKKCSLHSSLNWVQ